MSYQTFLEELDEILAPVHSCQGSAADLFWWNLSPSSEMPVVAGETGQAKNIVLVVARATKNVPETTLYLSFHKLQEDMIKYNH